MNLPPAFPAPGILAQLPSATLRALTPADFAAWMQLRNEVLAGLAHPDLYVREADEAAFFAQNSLPRGECIGVFLGEELVAYAMLGMPAAGEDGHLGAVVGMPTGRQAGVAHLASCMVRAPWRGNKLQALLLRLRCAVAQAYDRPLCLAVVSLHNAASRHNLLAHGMWIEWTGVIDGLRRHVLQIDLLGRQRWDLQDSRLIAGDDFAQLCAAAASGYGGVAEVVDGGRRMLRFARRLPDAMPPGHCAPPL
ncbi:hypothetical protein [Pantoea sp. 18069]|uniref:hypothetical protein n=1 Tax=Pantoea sp. 18069 TaxID=2681415 RepID=UPI00135B9F5C|nr:hypothetical protein [Pantoea sp. 18069]